MVLAYLPASVSRRLKVMDEGLGELGARCGLECVWNAILLVVRGLGSVEDCIVIWQLRTDGKDCYNVLARKGS